MNPLLGLIATWVLVTGTLIVLFLFRSRLESKETDWIPLTEDTREDKAIAEQKTIEGRVHKFDRPIQALGALSVVLLLTIISYWAYTGLSTPPPMP
jgi:hypothetical protein